MICSLAQLCKHILGVLLGAHENDLVFGYQKSNGLKKHASNPSPTSLLLPLLESLFVYVGLHDGVVELLLLLSRSECVNECGFRR